MNVMQCNTSNFYMHFNNHSKCHISLVFAVNNQEPRCQFPNQTFNIIDKQIFQNSLPNSISKKLVGGRGVQCLPCKYNNTYYIAQFVIHKS